MDFCRLRSYVIFSLMMISLGGQLFCMNAEAAPPAGQLEEPISGHKLSELQREAEAGNAKKQSQLGTMYAYGRGVPVNIAKAVEWWRKAAAQGDATGQYYLGLAHQSGVGVPKDQTKAAEFYRQAALQSHAEAQLGLAQMYLVGSGVPQDVKAAFEWYRKAAEAGLASAQIAMAGLCERFAEMYEKGDGVPANPAKVAEYRAGMVEWYRRAAIQGHVDAQYALGLIYENGKGVSKDTAKAFAWLYLAMKQGHKKAGSRLLLYTEAARSEGMRMADRWKKGEAMK